MSNLDEVKNRQSTMNSPKTGIKNILEETNSRTSEAEEQKDHEKIFEKIAIKNFAKMGEEIAIKARMLPQAWVSQGRSFHHQSRGLPRSWEGTSAGSTAEASRCSFLPDARGLENPHSLFLSIAGLPSPRHAHTPGPVEWGLPGPPVGSADIKVLSGSVASLPTRGSMGLSLTLVTRMHLIPSLTSEASVWIWYPFFFK